MDWHALAVSEESHAENLFQEIVHAVQNAFGIAACDDKPRQPAVDKRLDDESFGLESSFRIPDLARSYQAVDMWIGGLVDWRPMRTAPSTPACESSVERIGTSLPDIRWQ